MCLPLLNLMLVSFSEFAIIKGCSKGAVTHASKDRIAAAVVEEDGKRWLDRDMALDLWRKNTLKTHCSKTTDADPVELKRVIKALPEDAIPDLNESRARREHYQAELAKLQVAQQRKELIAADDVKKQAYQMGRSVREALSNLADRLSHELAGEVDATRIHQLLTDEHRAALMELTNG